MKKNFLVLNAFLILLVFKAPAYSASNYCPNNFDAEKFWRNNYKANGFNLKGDKLSENISSFLKDSSLGLELRNERHRTKIETEYQTQTDNEWAQVEALRFSSGMFMGIIGIDAVHFGVLHLKAKEEGPYSYSDFFKDTDENFQKAGVSLKISPFKGLLLKTGRVESPHLLLGPGDYKTAPRMYEIDSVNYKNGPVSISYIKAKGASDYVDEGYSDFTVNVGSWQDKKYKKRPVHVADFEFDTDIYSFKASYAQQKDFLDYTFIENRFYFPISDDLKLRADINYRNKELKQEDIGNVNNSLSMWAGRIAMTYKQFSLNFAYSQVQQNPDMFGTMGVDWMLDGSVMAGCKEGGYYVNAVQGIFTHDGEHAFKIEPEFKFKGILEGLSVSAYYIRGWNIHGGYDWSINQRQHEYGGNIHYNPSFFQPLTIDIRHGRNHMKSDGEYGMDQRMQNTEIEVKYTFLLF